VPEVYDPVQLVKDATKFARSQFGQHYLNKLEARVSECTRNAVNPAINRSDRADWGLLASEAQRQIDYFKTAQATAASPTLLQKLAEGFKARMKKEDIKKV
jgi:hypothetical protein